MKSKHLTEEILQAFLLKEIHDDTIAIHIAECSICRTKLENYQYLVDSIQQITPETFSFDVATVVMDKIVHYEQKKNRKNVLVFWGTLVVLLGGIGFMGLPVLQPILKAFSSIPLFTNLFIWGTSVSVVLYLLADIYKQYKIKEKQYLDTSCNQ